jgi:hypothetical protein
LDYGLTEECYWTSTLAEVIRAIESRKRQMKLEDQERAAFDYILADMIGRSVARLYSSSANLPQINEVYPTLFDSAEIEAQKQEKKTELSILRFKQFAQTYNKRFNKEVGEQND